MNHTPFSLSGAAATTRAGPDTVFSISGRSAAVLRALRHAWQQLWLDPRTAYLSRAEDLADLERRLRAWEQPRTHIPTVLW